MKIIQTIAKIYNKLKIQKILVKQKKNKSMNKFNLMKIQNKNYKIYNKIKKKQKKKKFKF